MDEYMNLKFASLFHDIGKFYQRADNQGKSSHAYDSRYSKLNEEDYGRSGAHSKWSADFTKDYFGDIVEDLVLYHHKPLKSGYPELCKILKKADEHSSKERIDSDEKNDVLLTPLTSIFSRIDLSGKQHEDYYVPLVELDFNNSLHPQKEKIRNGWNLVPQYQQLWAKFEKEFKLLQNKDFESVLAILRKYTSTVPSATYYSESDISLYDHLKTTAAIANCRYIFSKDEKLLQTDDQEVYRIINGDISGIQNFIYRVQTPEDAQSGMSKRLRGRSLYLTLLCEAIASKIILDLNLDSTNILFCGGGRFTIIAPNTQKTEEIINKINLEVNKAFIDNFNAELFLNIVSVKASGDDLGNFDEILSKLTQLLSENKKHKFIGQLEDVFKVESEANYDLCPVCGNKAEGKYCHDCMEHEHLGSVVSNAKYMIKYVSKDKIPKSLFYPKLEIGYAFKRNKKDVIKIVGDNPDVRFTVYKLNDTDFLDFRDEIISDNVSFDFKVIANRIPNIHGTPLYFNHLAEIAKGANKLGVLKMDVDNLGLIFSKGFRHLGEGATSISRISSLSFYLDLFFSGLINQIVDRFSFTAELPQDMECEMKTISFVNEDDEVYKSQTVYRPKDSLPEGEGTSTIHINYSGGDDLLVVGPYDDIIKFAEEFRCRFKKWTADNCDINISAGISIVSPKFPIGKAADMADEELEKSKGCGRDKITVFGDTLMWDSNGHEKGFDEIFEFARYMEDKNESKEVSRGFTHSLLNIWENNYSKKSNISNEEDWTDDIQKRISTKAYIPVFKYKLRLINNREVRDYIDKNGIKLMPWIKTPVSWVSLRLR
ncbi:type III-A CRISPR-associated protein Cas10/Csm1 [Methanobrevibacter sp.]